MDVPSHPRRNHFRARPGIRLDRRRQGALRSRFHATECRGVRRLRARDPGTEWRAPGSLRSFLLLAANEVEFFVVGMPARVRRAAPVATIDLHVVNRRTPENVARLLRVLASLDAVYRHDPRRLRPRESHLLGPSHHLLTTTQGDFDCLGAI